MKYQYIHQFEEEKKKNKSVLPRIGKKKKNKKEGE